MIPLNRITSKGVTHMSCLTLAHRNVLKHFLAILFKNQWVNMLISLIITYQGAMKNNTMTQRHRYDTSWENNIEGADSYVLFNCGPSRCIKRLSCNLILNSVTKYVDQPNNHLPRGSGEEYTDVKPEIWSVWREQHQSSWLRGFA